MNDTPDPRPAGETALTDEQVARIIGEVEARVGMGHGAWDMVKPGELVEGFRAALIADAPVVWVATDDVGQPDRHSRIWAAEPVLARGRIFLSPDDVPTTPCMAMDSQIVPPGTCVRYRLVPDPEEPHA